MKIDGIYQAHSGIRSTRLAVRTRRATGTEPACSRSAVGLITVRICPDSQIGQTFDYFVGKSEQPFRHVETECFGGLEVSRFLALSARLAGGICWLPSSSARSRH